MPLCALLPLLAATFFPLGEPDSDPPAAVTARLTSPEEQGEAFLALFKGAKAPNPPAALAAWKKATGGRSGLSKPLEAVLSMFNPGMVRELRVFHETELRLGFQPGKSQPRWQAVAPHDDGTIAALAESLMLTGGASEPLLGTAQVLRLGPPGAALASARPTGLAVASTREGLRRTLARNGESPFATEARPGLHVRLDPASLPVFDSVPARRWTEALHAVGCQNAVGWLTLKGDTVELDIKAKLGSKPLGARSIDPRWLDVVPAVGVIAAVTLGIDTTEAPLGAMFDVLDRIDRADPKRAGLAPLRTRLNVIATVARVRPEVELWPNLQGLTLAVLSNGNGELGGGMLALHVVDADAAGQLASRVVPRLLASFMKADSGGEPKPDGVRTFKAVRGRSLQLVTRGPCVLIGWGVGALDAALKALANPRDSSGAALRATWSDTPPQRAGGFWPGRWNQVLPAGSPLGESLESAPPIVWSGRTDGAASIDLVRWTGLRSLVHRSLESLPLESDSSR
jgi:hypothetical protein